VACAAAGCGPDTRHALRSINVTGFAPDDQFVNSTALQAKIASRNIPYLRIPFRDGWTDSQYLRMLDAVVNAGATPLAIVHGACTNSLSVSDHYLNLVDRATKKGAYFVEYGNEEDHSCNGGPAISPATYTAGWNRDIPTLHAHHPRAHFIGPVTATYHGAYIQKFMQTAKPRPDAVSYHDYACDASDSNQTCLDGISAWSTFATDLKNRMRNNVGYTVPVWITEWNMDPFDEVRYQQPFIQTWTSRALREWSSLRKTGKVAVTFLYAISGHGTFNGSCSGFQLFCADKSMTLQGKTFFRNLS
jgi:hypothetical protein